MTLRPESSGRLGHVHDEATPVLHDPRPGLEHRLPERAIEPHAAGGGKSDRGRGPKGTVGDDAA